MSPPLAPVRLPWGVATLALVSVLHTSVAARAQAPGAPPDNSPQRPGASAPASPPAGNDPAESADSARERARTAYGAGQDAYAAEQYAAAEAHFALADSLLPAVQAKYWRAMSLDKLGNVASAYEAFGRVLASDDKAQLGAEKLAIAEARHRELAAAPADLTVTTTPAGARINVSGVDLRGLTPLTLRLAPGRHVVRASLDGYQPQQIEIIATPGGKLTPNLTLVPAPRPPIAPMQEGLSVPPTTTLVPSTPVERSKIPGYVTLGIAGASAIVGAIFGVQALGDKQDFQDNPTTSKADDVERNALIADMAFGVTLTLGITGIVLLFADDPVPAQTALAEPALRAPSRASLRVLPYVAPQSAGAAASLTF